MKEIFAKNKSLIITISFVFILLFIISTGIFLYKKDKLDFLVKNSFFDKPSAFIYKIVWQGKYEKELLESDLKLSNIQKEKAENRADQEGIARVRAEEETQVESVKRNQAEAKAKQEEFEKNLKEQKLSEKEAEEKKMSADNDGDGLTYRRELELGTSDWNNDSDNDGIKDREDLHPAGGGSNMPQTFAWSYGNYNYTFTTSLPEDWFFYYKNKPRLSAENITYVTYGDKFIKEIADKVLAKARENSYCEACLATAFIQSLPYVEDVYTGYDEYPKYPLETLFEKNGDCEDTSYLTAAIIRAMNIDTVLVLLPGHMAVGVWADCDTPGTYYKVGDKCYYYLETTGDGFNLGDIPDTFKYTPATLVSIPEGQRYNVIPRYVKPCDSSSVVPGYYYDGVNFYSDSQCYNLVYCMNYKGYYVDGKTSDLFWDSSCAQIVVKGCIKSTTYSGYFTDGAEYYNDSKCSQRMRLCRPSSVNYGMYWNGYNLFWDSGCNQNVVSGCTKSTYYPSYFFDGTKYYSDHMCSVLADPH
jgi:hypothetical protein